MKARPDFIRPLRWTVAVLLSFLAGSAHGQTLSFPGAEGAGRFTSGGRGGSVYIVTNLNDSGAGSLRDGLSASGARTIVFEVSGTINLQSPLYTPQYNVTVAGETAPGDGICLAGQPWLIGANNVIARHIRSRTGNNAGGGDAITIGRSDKGTTNVILDHVSASWSTDENLSAEGKNITVQWSVISEGLLSHSMGSLIRGSNGAEISYHHNLFAHNNSRNPRPGNYLTAAEDPTGLRFDFRNNVVYNWGGAAAGANFDTDGVSKYNFVNNYYNRGPDSGTPAFEQTLDDHCQAYFAGNYMNGSLPADQWSLVTGQTGGSYRLTSPLATAPVTTQSAPDAYSAVLAGAGASISRDTVDARIVQEVRSGAGGIIDDEADRGGWKALASLPAPADTDRDGMPDYWETANGLNPNNASDRNLTNAAGYTRLEEYLHFRATKTGAPATWDSTAATGWGTASNWAENALPSFGNTQDVTFFVAGTAMQNSNLGGGNRTVRGITFDEGADSAATIFLSSDNSDSGTARTLTFDTDQHGFAGPDAHVLVRGGATGNISIGSGLGSIVLAANLAVHHDGSGGLFFKRPITETGGAKGIIKSGSGEMTLEGANTFTGGIFIHGGKVALNGISSEDNEPDVWIASGGTLSVGAPFVGNTATIGNLTGNGLVDPQYGSATGTRTLRINQTSDGTFSGNLNDATSGSRVLAVKKIGSGRLTLSATDSTYSGGTVLYAGTLRVSADGSLGAAGGDFTFEGGGSGILMNNDTAVTLNSGRQVNLTGDGRLQAGWGKNLTIAGKITGAGALRIVSDSNPGFVVLTNTGNDYSGITEVQSSGKLQLGASNVLPDGTTVHSTGTIDLNGKSDTVKRLYLYSGAVSTGSGSLTLSNSGGTGINVTANAGNMAVPWNIVLGSQSTATNNLDFGCATAGDTLTLSGMVSSPSGYGFDVWPSTSTVVFGNANTYTGLTYLFGTLRLGVNNAINSGNDVLLSSGTLDLNGKTQTLDKLEGAGSVALGVGALTIGSGGSSFTFGGVISGSGSLTKSGGGTVTLTGNNTFSGNVTINAPGATTPSVLTITHSNALGAGIKIVNITSYGRTLKLDGSGGALTLASGISFNTSNNGSDNGGASPASAPIVNVAGNSTLNGSISLTSGGGGTVIQSDAGTLTLAGGISATTAGRSLEFTGDGNITVSGVIADGATAGLPVTKSGAGTLLLSGVNTYTGPTRVAAGRLSVVGRLSGTSGVTVDAAGTLELSNPGSSVLLPSVDISAQGVLNVTGGNQEIGVISGTGSTSVAAGCRLTANSIVQDTLTIGAGGSVTIRPTTAGNAVPEPGTWVLIGTALLGWLTFRRLRG
jgi:autotransporter-associated beta strand protein